MTFSSQLILKSVPVFFVDLQTKLNSSSMITKVLLHNKIIRFLWVLEPDPNDSLGSKSRSN